MPGGAGGLHWGLHWGLHRGFSGVRPTEDHQGVGWSWARTSTGPGREWASPQGPIQFHSTHSGSDSSPEPGQPQPGTVWIWGSGWGWRALAEAQGAGFLPGPSLPGEAGPWTIPQRREWQRGVGRDGMGSRPRDGIPAPLPHSRLWSLSRAGPWVRVPHSGQAGPSEGVAQRGAGGMFRLQHRHPPLPLGPAHTSGLISGP